MSEPLFSIVIACYNQEAFVRRAVQSALAQEHPSKEVIVIDDGSCDRTPDILDDFGKSILAVKLPVNRGAVAARNHGAARARGKYLVFLDGDDVLMPWALEVYARVIAACAPKVLLGRCVVCHGPVPEADPADFPRRVQFVEYPNFLAKDRPCIYNTSTLVVDRLAFASAGGWTPGLFFQDMQDLLMKLALTNTVLVVAPDTVWYRMHPGNAMHKVALFVAGVHKLLAKAKAGEYPGGHRHWLSRSAWFGGLIFYWAKVSLAAGQYRDALRLLAPGWWMVLLAAARRAKARLTTRTPTESLPLLRPGALKPAALGNNRRGSDRFRRIGGSVPLPQTEPPKTIFKHTYRYKNKETAR